MKPETMLFSSWKMLRRNICEYKSQADLCVWVAEYRSKPICWSITFSLSGWLAQVPSLDRQVALRPHPFRKDFGAEGDRFGQNLIDKISPLWDGILTWVISSVWLERYVDIVEVTGSNPVSPTTSCRVISSAG